MQATLTVTAKGQVTLRREVLEHLSVVPGDKITIDLLPSGRAEVRAARAPGSIEGFIGCLYQPGTQPQSLEDFDKAIADGWAGVR
jgi:bifunctional DNA-binding transcriptional regulator/antitoxin component of YhaV-PrlF toxin-antitoxin module